MRRWNAQASPSGSLWSQAAGQAIADALFGAFNPGGRLTISVPYDAGSLPAFYIHRVTKPEIHIPHYLDIPNPVLICLLRRQGSSIVIANKQLVAFNRLYVEASETITNDLELEVDRYLPSVNREYERVLEAGDYAFLLSDDGSLDSPVLAKTTLGVETSHKY
ncbi:hypothetical protein CDV36_006301 [Fusarium kuroshium]|uniref:Uncharacterized protein n=1 Tax=Fusarium kuroshium TaxID=2010991 RepID=A0A3M2S932_9HYPO|nr:hypothetical protein CDV36_006301 [Fusarium kuroshium]